ncbi:MAG TPA: prepilin-type N-terminal cleavage/methylation domain-containing protein [Gaiellaceae bacterium]|jgi:prepilin-type N-terminal cleavage/methylation domain-containing protein|nr:prepilin-type N-terminal cleavage/methylation domain-containing protein [Gaiellaceae bacterium]
MTRRLCDLRAERGFTLVELLATMAIMSIVLVVFAQVLITTSNTSSRVEEQATLQNQVRASIDRLTTDFRQATNTDGTSPVESVSGTTLTFDSPDRMTPFHLRRISYQLVNGVLSRSVTTSTDTDGWPWIWPAAGPWQEEVGSVTTTTPFVFLDANGAPTTDPNAVRSVRVTLAVAPHQKQGGSASYSAVASIRTLQ